MATVLSKDLVRETTEKINDKEIIITMTSDQRIELKLKGKRGKGDSIAIIELYNQLCGSIVNEHPKGGSLNIVKVKSKPEDRKMISLYDLRSHNAISMLDMETLTKFDQIIKSVIDSHK